MKSLDFDESVGSYSRGSGKPAIKGVLTPEEWAWCNDENDDFKQLKKEAL